MYPLFLSSYIDLLPCCVAVFDQDTEVAVKDPRTGSVPVYVLLDTNANGLCGGVGGARGASWLAAAADVAVIAAVEPATNQVFSK